MKLRVMTLMAALSAASCAVDPGPAATVDSRLKSVTLIKENAGCRFPATPIVRRTLPGQSSNTAGAGER